jgi:hypothetical protein
MAKRRPWVKQTELPVTVTPMEKGEALIPLIQSVNQ